jgi:hypothetical protein
MALFDDAGTIQNMTRPGQTVGSTDIMSQAITEYGGHVEGTIARRSTLHGFIPLRPVRGTNSVTNYAVGEATLGKVTPGVAPDAAANEFGKASLTIDTLVYARNTFPLLETFQTQYDARKEVGQEHGKKIAKFFDQSMFIAAAKTSLLTESKFSNAQGNNKPAGHSGGNKKTLAAAGDATDPAKLYSAIRDLFVLFEAKDVVPQMDDIILAFRPQHFYILQDAEQIVNGDYLTSDGNKMTGIPIFKALGVPVLSSNNLPNTNISGHLLSNTANGNFYDGDFTKLVAVAFSSRALLAGETIPLTSDVFYDKTYKMWFVDSHLSYGVTSNRAEYAGSIYLP